MSGEWQIISLKWWNQSLCFLARCQLRNTVISKSPQKPPVVWSSLSMTAYIFRGTGSLSNSSLLRGSLLSCNLIMGVTGHHICHMQSEASGGFHPYLRKQIIQGQNSLRITLGVYAQCIMETMLMLESYKLRGSRMNVSSTKYNLLYLRLKGRTTGKPVIWQQTWALSRALSQAHFVSTKTRWKTETQARQECLR